MYVSSMFFDSIRDSPRTAAAVVSSAHRSYQSPGRSPDQNALQEQLGLRRDIGGEFHSPLDDNLLGMD